MLQNAARQESAAARHGGWGWVEGETGLSIGLEDHTPGAFKVEGQALSTKLAVVTVQTRIRPTAKPASWEPTRHDSNSTPLSEP